MMNPHLVDDINASNLVVEPMKKGYSRGLIEAGKQNKEVVAASSDVSGSTGTDGFAGEFPDRFIEVGIAEQNLVTMAAGLAAMGKIPFVAAYAAFSPGRNWEQIRTTICLNNRPVKLISTHVGLSDAPDGATHQMLEDLALMRALPNMIVIAPCDSQEAEKVITSLAFNKHPVYVRIARDDTAIFTTPETPFELGKAQVFAPGDQVTIVSTGRMTHRALIASKKLAKEGIGVEVVHCPTIKPLDSETILASVIKTGRVITAEEAQINGGLGGAIAELLGEQHPVPLKRIGMPDHFGESGKPEELFEKFGLTARNIEFAVHELIK